jgi:HTH-type transcriptional regulator/antitoxin HipB
MRTAPLVDHTIEGQRTLDVGGVTESVKFRVEDIYETGYCSACTWKLDVQYPAPIRESGHSDECGHIPGRHCTGISPDHVVWGYPRTRRCMMPALKARKQQDIAAVIKAARESTGRTQSALAEQLTIPVDYLGDLESGRGTIYTSRLFRVLHELGISVTLTYGDDHASP